MKSSIVVVIAQIVLYCSCKKSVTGEYTGGASVTTGLASTTTENLYSNGIRVAGLGSITATDGTTWTVPAEVNFSNTNFPIAPDLYNPDGNKYENSTAALAAFNSSNVIEIDAAGEIITG
jgi:hypothetical protein